MVVSYLLYGLVFVAGLFIGSFLNVVSDRVVQGKKFLLGRSVCDFCKKVLTPIELIPVFSYVIQGSRCRKCKKKLSGYYPLSEFLTGLLFLITALNVGVFNVVGGTSVFSWIVFIYLLVVVSFFIILLMTDLKYMLLPNKIMYPAIIFVLVFTILSAGVSLWLTYKGMAGDEFGRYLIKAGYWDLHLMRVIKTQVLTLVSTVVLGGFFWGLTLIKDGKAMGGGDVKLAVLIGLFNGFPNNVLGIFLGFFFGAMTSIGLIVFGKKTMKDTVPFGPFLIVGSLVALYWGESLLDWYFGLF